MSSQRVILQLNLQDADGQHHVLQQEAVLPQPILPGIFLTGVSVYDIPRVAPEGAPIDSVIRGVILDLTLAETICLLPQLVVAAYTLAEWLPQHPRWKHVATEPSQDDKPDWLKDMGSFESQD